MTPTPAIATLAFVFLLWIPGAVAKRRLGGGGGGGSYCVDDQNQRVLCGNTIASIVGGVISGLFFLGILYCIGMALWRRRRFRRRLLVPKTAADEDHPETSTIASGSTFPNTTDTIHEPAPAHTRFPQPDPYKPNVAPVGTYAAPQGPPTV